MKLNNKKRKWFALLVLMQVAFVQSYAEGFDLQKEQEKLSNRVFNHYDQDKNSLLSFEEFSLFAKDMKKKSKSNEF